MVYCWEERRVVLIITLASDILPVGARDTDRSFLSNTLSSTPMESKPFLIAPRLGYTLV